MTKLIMIGDAARILFCFNVILAVSGEASQPWVKFADTSGDSIKIIADKKFFRSNTSVSIDLLYLGNHNFGCSFNFGKHIERWNFTGTESYNVRVSYREHIHPGYYCTVVKVHLEDIAACPWISNNCEFFSGIKLFGDTKKMCKDWKCIIHVIPDYPRNSFEVNFEVYGSLENCSLKSDSVLVHNCSNNCSQRTTINPQYYRKCFKKEVTLENKNVVSFEKVTPGNYCVIIKPDCPNSDDCPSFYKSFIFSPSMPSTLSPVPSEGPEFSWPLITIIVVVLVIVICFLIRFIFFRQNSFFYNGIQNTDRFHLLQKELAIPEKVITNVLYSRDCKEHNIVVIALCKFLEKHFPIETVYDEKMRHNMHMENDWPVQLVSVPCQNKSKKKLLVIESEGGWLKQRAFHNHMDISEVSDSNIDDMYHISISALSTKQDQPLIDYCHIKVARFTYTPSSAQIDIVTQTRYTLPDNLCELIVSLLLNDESVVVEVERMVKNKLEEAKNSSEYQLLKSSIENMHSLLEKDKEIISKKFQTFNI